MNVYRKLWTDTFGIIPKDINGRSFEIHHIDKNRKNNNIDNLQCVSILEHFQIHYNSGDFGAAYLIGKRMELPVDYLSKIQIGIKRPGIGGRKKGCIAWNKNKKIHSEEQKSKWSLERQGKRYSSKITKETAIEIKNLFKTNPKLYNIGTISKNGKKLTYERLFAKKFASNYNLTELGLLKIIRGETWTNV
jgi:hypothetical protein